MPLAGRALRVQVAVRLPTQTTNQLWSDDYWGRYAAATGWNAARGERSGAFTIGLTTGTALLDWRPSLGPGTSLRLLAGSALVHDRNAAVSYDGNGQEIPANVWDVQWRGAAQLWQRFGPVLLNGGVSVLNRPSFDQSRVTDCEWGAAAGLQLGRFTPLVQARIPRNQPESVPGGASRLNWWNLAISLQFRPR